MLGRTVAIEKGQNIKAKYNGPGIGFNVELPQTAPKSPVAVADVLWRADIATEAEPAVKILNTLKCL